MFYECGVINMNPSCVKIVKKDVVKKRDSLLFILCLISISLCFISIILDIFALSLLVAFIFPFLFILFFFIFNKRFNKEVGLISHCKHKKELIRLLIKDNKLYFIDKKGKEFRSLIFVNEDVDISNNYKNNILDFKLRKIHLVKLEDDLT